MKSVFYYRAVIVGHYLFTESVKSEVYFLFTADSCGDSSTLRPVRIARNDIGRTVAGARTCLIKMMLEYMYMQWETIRTYRIAFLLGASGILFFSIGTILWLTSSWGQAGRQEKIDILQQTSETGANTVDTVVVDIQGAVVDPGTYTLPAGSRVSDLIDVSGGFRDDADMGWVSKHINNAQRLPDGGKIYIPVQGEPLSSSDGVVAGTSTVNINAASSSELEALPGIGQKTAEKIISSRPYGSIDELLEKEVIGRSVFEKIRDKITVL